MHTPSQLQRCDLDYTVLLSSALPLASRSFFQTEDYSRLACSLLSASWSSLRQDTLDKSSSDCIIEVISNPKMQAILDAFFQVKWAVSEVTIVGAQDKSCRDFSMSYPYSSLRIDELPAGTADKMKTAPLSCTVAIPFNASGNSGLVFARSPVLDPNLDAETLTAQTVLLENNFAYFWSGAMWTKLLVNEGSSELFKLLQITFVPIFINKASNVADHLDLDSLQRLDARLLQLFGIGTKYPKRELQPKKIKN